MSLAEKAGKAGALMLFRKGWGAIVNIGVMAYLARTLDKSDFGLVAISGTLLSIIQTFGVAGISEYIIFYNGDDEKEKQNGAFWLNAFLTLLITITVFVLAPFWASFYKDSRITKIVYLLLVGFNFTMFSSIPLAIFRKKLEFKKMIKTQTVFGTLSQVSQIIFVYFGFGVYSLALPSAIVIPMMTVVLYLQSGYEINFKDFGIKQWKTIIKYTKHVVGNSILSKIVNEGDTLLVGKMLGMEALGVYDLAYKFANIVNNQLLPIITNISLPVFSKNNNDIKLTRDRFLKSSQLIAIIIFPISGMIFLFASDIVNMIYGEKWNLAIVPLQIFCIHSAFRSISSSSSGLYYAMNKPQYGFYFSLVFTPIFILGVLISAKISLLAVCIAVTITRVLGGLVSIKLAINLIDLSLINFFKKIFTSIVFTTIITFVLYLFYFNHNVLTIILFLILYLIFYIFLNFMFKTEPYVYLKTQINNNLKLVKESFQNE